MARKVQINKGIIQDNALEALVKSNLFRHKIMKPKKGKGSYTRKGRQGNLPFILSSQHNRYFQDSPALIKWKVIQQSSIRGISI